MDDTPHTEPSATPEPVRAKGGRGWVWALLAILIAFGAGFFWQWYEGQMVREQLGTTAQELEIERLRVRLGEATLAAQAGDYESARQEMSELFTHVQGRMADLPPEVAAVVEDFLAMRDEIITGLSRSNPEYAGILYGMIERLGNAVDRAEGGGGPEVPVDAGGAGGEPEPGSADTGGEL